MASGVGKSDNQLPHATVPVKGEKMTLSDVKNTMKATGSA